MIAALENLLTTTHLHCAGGVEVLTVSGADSADGKSLMDRLHTVVPEW